MKALILVGGFGTRLRPLTFSVPKPLVDFCNIPILVHQIEALAKVGVKEVILAINQQQPAIMDDYMKEVQTKYNIKITYSIENTPMGTAGPLKLAEENLIKENLEELFFVLNSDVTCDFPLQKMIEFHKSHKKEGTILLTKVQDPSKYGVVLHNDEGQIQDFIEKPQNFVGDKINAGIYIFTLKILKRIQMKPTSIEREIFPIMAKDKELFAMTLQGFWMDIGQPKDYLQGQKLYLKYLNDNVQEQCNQSRTLSQNSVNIIGNVLIDSSAIIGENCIIGPDVVIGKNCKIRNGVRIRNSTILSESEVKESAFIEGSIVGWANTIGKWARVQGLSVFGEDVQIADEVFINQTIVLPHKAVNTNQEQKDKIIM